MTLYLLLQLEAINFVPVYVCTIESTNFKVVFFFVFFCLNQLPTFHMVNIKRLVYHVQIFFFFFFFFFLFGGGGGGESCFVIVINLASHPKIMPA